MSKVQTSNDFYFNRTIQYREDLIVKYDHTGCATVSSTDAERLEEIDPFITVIEQEDSTLTVVTGSATVSSTDAEIPQDPPAPSVEGKIDLSSLKLEEMKEICAEEGLPEEEWKNIRTKANMIVYLEQKVFSSTTPE